MSLAVTVHGASELVAADRGNTSDPFVVVCLEGGEEQRTEVRKKTLTPTWETMLALPLPTPGAANTRPDLICRVFDWDKVGDNDFLGEVRIPATAWHAADGSRQAFTLGIRTGGGRSKSEAKRKITGEVYLSFLTSDPPPHHLLAEGYAAEAPSAAVVAKKAPEKKEKKKRGGLKARLAEKVAKKMEKKIVKIINKVLDGYVDINREHLDVNILDGIVELTDLELLPSAFSSLGLPIELVASHVGLVRLEIPFKHLKSQPIKVIIRGIVATLRPSDHTDLDSQKAARLAKHETAWKAAGESENHSSSEDVSESSDDDEKPSAYQQKIMENIQLTLEDVHIRYEDSVSSRRSSWAVEDTATTFAAGITLDRLEVKSYLVDMLTGVWQKGTAKVEQRFANKQIVLGELLASAGSQSQSGFAVYCNEAEPAYEYDRTGGSSDELWRAHMLSSIAREGRPLPTMSYILGPQSLKVQLSLDTDPTESNDVSRVWWGEKCASGAGEEVTKGASTEAKLKIPEISVNLSHEMARHGYNVLVWMHRAGQPEVPGQPARPSCRPRKSEDDAGGDCKAWWQYAIGCTVQEHRMHVSHIQLDHIRKAVRRAKDYVDLYKRKWHGDRNGYKTLHKKERAELVAMEETLDYRTIVDLRELAWAQLYQDDAKKGHKESMTEQQLILIGVHQKTEKVIAVKKAVSVGDAAGQNFQLRVGLQVAALKVSLSMHDKPLLDLQLKDFSVDLSQRVSGSTVASVCIQQIDVSDRYTPSAIFPELLSSQGAAPFFDLRYEDAVTAECDKVAITITTAQIQVAFNHSIVGVMTEFAQMSDDSVFDEDIQAQLEKQVEDQKTRLMEELGKQCQLNNLRESILTLDCSISGPVFIVPQRCSSLDGQPTRVLVVDLGCLKIVERPFHNQEEQSEDNEFDITLSDFDIRLDEYTHDGKSSEKECSLIDTDGLTGTVFTDKKSFDPSGTKMKADLSLPSAMFTISEDEIKALAELGASVQLSLAAKPKQTIAKPASTKNKKKQTLQRKKTVEKGAVGDMSKALQEAWAQIDTNGDGSLDRCELKGVLEIVGKTPAQIEQLISSGEIDEDGDDSVSFAEFQSWWDGHILKLLRDWKLLCLTVRVEHLSLLVKKVDGENLIKLSVNDTVVKVVKRLLDHVVDVDLREFVIKDCEWEDFNVGNPADLLRLGDTKVRLVNVEKDSGLDALKLDETIWEMPEKVSHALTDVEVGSLAASVRLELVNDLQALVARAGAVVNATRPLNAPPPPPPPAATALPNESKVILNLKSTCVGLVPRIAKADTDTLAILQATNVHAEVDTKADGEMEVDVSVQGIRLEKCVESDTPPALAMGTADKSCITVNLTQPSTDAEGNPSMRVRVHTLHTVVSREVLHGVQEWMLDMAPTEAAEVQTQAPAPSPSAVDADAPTKTMMIDFEVDDISVVVPVAHTPGGIKLEIAKVKAKLGDDAKHIKLGGLALYHYVGQHDHLQSGSTTIEHVLLLSEPLDVSLAVKSSEFEQSITVKLPSNTCMMLSFRDLRLLKETGVAMKALKLPNPEPQATLQITNGPSLPPATATAAESKTPWENNDSPRPCVEPEPELEVEVTPGKRTVVRLDNFTKDKILFERGQSVLAKNEKEPVSFAIAIFDDAKGRHLSRQVMSLDLQLEELSMDKSAEGLTADVSLRLAIDHFDQHQAASPVLEPCIVNVRVKPDPRTSFMHTRTGGKLIALKIEPRIELIVTEALAIDLQRLKYQWKNKWEAKDTEGDNRASYAEIRNYTGLKLWFSMKPESGHSEHADVTLLAGEKHSLDHTETRANTHRPLEGLSGDIQLSLLGDLQQEIFSAPVSHSTVWYTAGKQSFVDVSAEKNGQCSTISVSGLFSIRNGLRDSFTVSSVVGHRSIMVPPGEERGLPIEVGPDDDITVTYTAHSGEKTFTFKMTPRRPDESDFVMGAEGKSCVRMVCSQHRVCCRPISSNDTENGFMWTTATQVELHPALVIANMLPMSIDIVYECGDTAHDRATHVTIEKGAMLEVDLHNPTEIVKGTTECMINSLVFRSDEPIQFTFGDERPETSFTESLTLTGAKKSSLPIELTLMHDVDPISGVRVVRIIASYWLINSGGLPVNLYNPGADKESSIAASSQVIKTQALNKVSEWITCDKDTTIFSPEGDTVELEIRGEKGVSVPFNVSAPASEGLLEVLTEEHGARQFGLVVSTRSHLGSDETAAWCRRLTAHPPTKIIQLSPRLIVLNHLQVDLCLRQTNDTNTDADVMLLPDQPCAVHMPDHEEHPSVQIRQGGGDDWSGSFRVDSVDEFPLRIRQSPKDRIVRVRVMTEGASIFIHIAEENDVYPHFRVKNLAGEGTRVTVRQADPDDGVLARTDTGSAVPMAELEHGETATVGWGSPSAEAMFQLEVGGKKLAVCPLTYGKVEHDCHDGPWKALNVHVSVEGPTRVIVVRRAAPGSSSEEEDSSIASFLSLLEPEPEPEPEPEDAADRLPVLSRVTVDVGGVGLCLVGHLLNGRRGEILALDLGTVNVEKTKFEGGAGGLEVKLESLQIDSMLSRPSCPVVVRAHPGVGEEKKSSLHLSLGTIKQPVKWAKHYSAIVIGLQALELNVEYAFVSQLMRWSRAVKSGTAIQLAELEDLIANETRGKAAQANMLRKAPAEEKVIFVRHFQLHPIKLTLTAELGQADEKQSLDIASAFGWVDVDEAPIRLSGLQLDNLLGAQAHVSKVVSSHLKQSFLGQVYKIIGSVGILGNPVGLVNKLGSGITMFFYEPIQGIQQGPEHFAIGVAKGTTGLVSSTVEGVFMAPAAVAGAVAEGLGALGAESHAAHGDKVHTLLEGLQFAGEDLKHDLYKATTSIFVAPYHGAKEGGAVGFAKGLGEGVGQTAVGAASTVVDLTANLTAGLSHLLSAPLSHDGAARLRLPRVVHRGGVVESLGLDRGNERRLKGQAIVDGLRHVGMMKEEFGMEVEGEEMVVGAEEYYNDHMETTQDGQWVLLTDQSLLLIDDADADETVSAEEVKWRLRLHSIARVVQSVRGIAVHVDPTILPDGTVVEAAPPRVVAYDIMMRTEAAASQLKTLLEAVVDAPVDEAWAVPVVGGHLRPELRGMTDVQAAEAIKEAQEEQTRRERWLEVAAKQRCCFLCKVYCGYIFCCGCCSSASEDDVGAEQPAPADVDTDGGQYSQVPTVSEDDDAIALLAPGVGRSDSAP